MNIGAYAPINGGINDVFSQLFILINGAQGSIQDGITNINNSQRNSQGVLDPIGMTQLQMLMQNYTSLVQMWSSIIKQFGDLDRSVAQNTGS